MDFRDDKIKDFADKLASSAPVPGGGGAAALCAALSAALSGMVFNLTIGKKTYEALTEDVKDNVKKSLNKCIEKVDEYLEYINKDGEAFSKLMDAYKLPKNSEAEVIRREESINKGLLGSMDIPYKLACDIFDMLNIIKTAAIYGYSNVISDAGVSVIIAYAALESCILNVMVNLKYLKGDKKDIQEHCDEMLVKGLNLKEEILKQVYKKI